MSALLPEDQHEKIRELLGVYALDAVDKETAAIIESHLGECVRCSIEVAQHHEVAGLLANSGGDSPLGLWDGIASHLDGSVPPSWARLAARLEPQDSEERAPRIVSPTGAPSTTDSGIGGPEAEVVPIGETRRRSRIAVRVTAAVAAAAAAVAIVLGVQVDHLNRQVTALQSQPSLTGAEQSALRDPATKQVQLTALSSPSAPAAKVTLVLTKSGTGFVEAGKLAALSGGRTYQLWAVIGNQTISLGLMGSAPHVVAFSVASNATVSAFAITAEQAGGVVHSVNQPVVAGEVTA